MKAELAAAGEDEALEALSTLEADPRTFVVDIAPKGLRWLRAKWHGSAFTDVTADAGDRLGGALSVTAGRRNFGKDVRMMHELGHVYFDLTESFRSYGTLSAWRAASGAFAVQMENAMRRASGCQPRANHGVRGPFCP